jgi:DNA (cytosine-5)-methyltransferase 1
MDEILKHFKTNDLPTELTVGSDCSGIEAGIQALKLLGIKVKHMYSCDNDAKVRKSIVANYNPLVLYDDILTRNHSLLPHVDMYIAGFPCQTFSLLGKRQGFDHPTKGTIFFECFETIKLTRPKCFILENVQGLLSHDKGRTMAVILNHLKSLNMYHINHSIYNTADYGLPQNRRRVFIVGMHKDHFNDTFVKPASIPLKLTVEDIIDDSYVKTDYVLTEHKQKLLDGLLQTNKIQSLNDPWVINLNASTMDRASHNRNISPCLLATVKYYYAPLKRDLIDREYLRLQGFPDSFKIVVSNNEMMKQCGNSMSTTVLCAIYSSIYKAEIVSPHSNNR